MVRLGVRQQSLCNPLIVRSGTASERYVIPRPPFRVLAYRRALVTPSGRCNSRLMCPRIWASRSLSIVMLGLLCKILALMRGRMVPLHILRAWNGLSGAAATLPAQSSIYFFRFGMVMPLQGPNILPRYLVASSGLTNGICSLPTMYGAVLFTVKVFPSHLMWNTYDFFTFSRKPTRSQYAWTSARFRSSPSLDLESTAVSSA